MKPLEVAQHYFDLSNESNFDEIKKLFSDTTTYSSQNTGIYLGVDSIIEMQKQFHAQFKNLHWHVNSVEEVKPGVILFDYTFKATSISGEAVEALGIEYVVVDGGKIVHVEIRNNT